MRTTLLLLGLTCVTPLAFVEAQVDQPTTLGGFLGILTDLINLLIPLIFAITFLTISWGVVKAWIMGEASEDDVERGKKLVLVGVIVLAVMFSIWGIVRLLQAGLFG